jgi:hypothetical protein
MDKNAAREIPVLLAKIPNQQRRNKLFPVV